jgi:hypothetical protein
MNWSERYASYRTRKYQRAYSPGPDVGGVPLSHPFTLKFINKRGDFDEYGVEQILKLHEDLKTNPNATIRMTRVLGLNENPKKIDPKEVDINPGDWCGIADPDDKPGLSIVHGFGDGPSIRVVKDLPGKHIYFHPAFPDGFLGLGYHPRRGLARGLGRNFNRTTVDESVRYWESLPDLGTSRMTPSSEGISF